MTQLNICNLINQIFVIEAKVNSSKENESLGRRFKRLYGEFEQLGYQMHNPLGEEYNETRTDCDATISGAESADLIIIEVLKPIIFETIDTRRQIVQRGIVIVESKSTLDKMTSLYKDA